jgi:hypothetical protein
MIDKHHILEEIKRIAKICAGKAPGQEKFQSETGIKKSDWYPHYWLRWGDALLEAGLSPNKMQTAFEDNELIEKYAGFIRELGHFPVEGEVRRKSKQDPSFPSHTTFNKHFRSKKQLAAKIIDFCRTQDNWGDVVELCIEHAGSVEHSSEDMNDLASDESMGFVYLIKSGRYYKIGRSTAVGRREYELAIQLPEKVIKIHIIKTDDPIGIEAYWHKRFQDRRRNGEWFELTSADVKTFKRRKFM